MRVYALAAAGLTVAAFMLRKKSSHALTLPSLAARQDNRLTRIAQQELDAWQGLDETDPLTWPRLTEYWQAVGVEPNSAIAQRTHWSAAFVSWLISEAYPGTLVPSQSHVGYLRAGLNAPAGSYRTVHPDGHIIKPGDIIVNSRGSTPATWNDLTSSGAFFPTHGDVVLSVDYDGALAVGGNTGPIGTVSTRTIPLTAGMAQGALAVMTR